MGRAPCCDKQGLKKGPWTPDEDQKLVAYIQRHGHGSWRALPKHAGTRFCAEADALILYLILEHLPMGFSVPSVNVGQLTGVVCDQNCRAFALWEELSLEVDELSEARY